jgi:hypothetical protein
MGIGGGLVGIAVGGYSVITGATSMEGTIAIFLLLLLAASLGIALGIQGLTYARASRYFTAMPDILLLIERIWRNDPGILTGTQAAEICDRAVDAIAKVFSQITGAPCQVSIEILSRLREDEGGPKLQSIDYLVVNLSRDSSSREASQDRRRHAVDGNASYREIFHDAACGAFFFRDDVAADAAYFTSEIEAEALATTGGKLTGRTSWPLTYRSTLVVKICEADLCRSGREHMPIAFLWLRSAEPGVFDERYEVELMQRMSRALAPIVTRCVKATMRQHDFRRRQASAQ